MDQGSKMQISIHNCNNIENGLFEIKKESLNVKYGVNGTGKTTITKALEAFITNNTNHKNALKPFKYMDDNDSNHEPNLTGFEEYKTISIFNEDYISSFIFQKDDLIKNSFEIFLSKPDFSSRFKNMDFCNQSEWDNLLLNCSFLFIRGEDSLSRACLSGIPFVWHAYVQSEDYQLVKVKALLEIMRKYFKNKYEGENFVPKDRFEHGKASKKDLDILDKKAKLIAAAAEL